MRKKRMAAAVALFTLLGFMACFPGPAAAGAKRGLLLWFNELVPVLFPFMVLSDFLVRTDLARGLSAAAYPLLHRLTGASRYGTYCIILGFVCGYPMGAKATSDLKRAGRINDAEARWLYGFVNNVSPMFVIQYLVHGQLNRPELLGLMLLCLYGIPLAIGIITGIGQRGTFLIPAEAEKNTSNTPLNFELFDACISDGILHITVLGAWVILFSIISAMISGIFSEGSWISLTLCGLTELTSGIHLTAVSSIPLSLKPVLIAGFAAFGGCSSLMQSVSVCHWDRRDTSWYLICKTAAALMAAGTVMLFLR